MLRGVVLSLVGLSLCILSASAQPFPEVSDLPEQPDLPDPFTMLDGSPVETPEDWSAKRRPELKALFQHYMYGVIPDPEPIETDVRIIDAGAFEGKATIKEIEIRFPDLPDDAPRIHLALFLPNEVEGPRPVFLAVNKCGNQTVANHPGLSAQDHPWLHEACADEDFGTRGARAEYWSLPYVIERGYGFATFQVADIDPDRDDFTDGIHPYFPDLPDSTRWGTLAAWAWGLHRAVDYLVTDEDVDADRISAFGHSRRGKAALFAAAMDERIAFVVPHQSGTGGGALSRNNDQETVERINRVFPHWFNDQFPKFNDREALLPFDQHLLIALVAPRPVLDNGGLKDTWANFESVLRALKAASPVYAFLGVEGLLGDGVIVEERVAEHEVGRLLQFRQDVDHTMTPMYWEAILDFADLHLGHE